jgi:hypothetical protein
MAASPRAAISRRRATGSANEDHAAATKSTARRTASRTSTSTKETPRLEAGSANRSRKAPSEENESSSPRSAAGSRNASRRAPTTRSLVQRVYNTIDGELTKLEKQKGLTSQDRERASRALAQMVNALEKAVEMQREMTKRKTSGGDAKSKEALAHAEDLRREIAERLERLNRKRTAVRRPE